MRRALALAIIVGASCAAVAAADGGGPSPGPSFGGSGKVNPAGTERYVAVPVGTRGTLVQAVRLHDANVIRWMYLRGLVGIPMVAFDGSLGGFSRDGARLVLASFPGARASSTTFVLVDPRSMRLQARVELRGSYAFDALSPDASLMYLIQYLGRPGSASQPYAVRAFSWNARKLLPGAIVDRREPDEKMNGQPVTRAGTPGGWAYTLYQRSGKSPFVHALDTVHRRAFCIDLAWRPTVRWLYSVKMRVRGRALELRRDGRTIARMDRRTLRVVRR